MLDVLAVVGLKMYTKVHASTRSKFSTAHKILRACQGVFEAGARASTVAAAIISRQRASASARAHVLGTETPETDLGTTAQLTVPQTTKQLSAKRKRMAIKGGRINSVKSALAARPRGDCHQCRAKDHAAEPGECPAVDKILAEGGKFCPHCAMSNHSNNECGILHPEMSKARAAGRAKEGAKAADVQAQLINELKAEVNAIKSMAMAAAPPPGHRANNQHCRRRAPRTAAGGPQCS